MKDKRGAVVCAFACRMKWSDQESIRNALTAGAARYDFLLDVRDCWPDATFADIRVRKVGAVHTSSEFQRVAKYRGLPDVKCGDRVRCGDWEGVIVGHNASANFDVLATTGPREGQTLNVHPNGMTLLSPPHSPAPEKADPAALVCGVLVGADGRAIEWE